MKRRRILLTTILLALVFATPALARQRKGKDKGPVGAKAIAALADCGAKRDSACVREQRDALKALGQKACPTLAETILTVEEPGQVPLAEAMALLKCPEVGKIAEKAFANNDADNRGPLAVALAGGKDKSLLEPIRKLVAQGRPYDRERGCEALAMLGDEAAIPTLVTATGHGLYSVRQQAARALGNFQGDDARKALCKLVESDSNIGVRIEAATALGTQKDKQSVPCLTKALADDSGPVKTAAHKALIDVSGLDVGMEVDAWEKWWKKNQSTGKQGRWR